MSYTDEKWAPIPTWEGFYEASTMGRIRSLDRTIEYVVYGKRVKRRKRGRMMNTPSTNNYQHVTLADGVRREQHFVHRLVTLTFIGPKPPKMVTCHNNGDPMDNRLENLRYDFHKANTADRKKHGTFLVGEAHQNAKLTDRDVYLIRRLCVEGVPQAAIARAFDCTPANVHMIIRGKSRNENANGEQTFQAAE